MGNNRKFNFDEYVDELLVEALSITQMQDQIKQVGLDPTKYDQNHFMFLVGLINSNQGIEIYDELLSKIKDKNLLKSLLSVSVNDRRSDKPTIDLDKIGRALENADKPAELRNILSGQKREIVKTEEPAYDADLLKWFLTKRNGLDLFDILIKIKPELDDLLEQFISEYNNEVPDVREYLKTNAQRAKTVQDLIAILHEGHSKNINPYNSTTSLTLNDLKQGALYHDEKNHLYIIRTTFQDDIPKSLRWNLKYGQGNRFGLCISSRTNNYYVDYRTGIMSDDVLTTYFVYRLVDNNLDPEDVNNYEIAIIDAMGNKEVYAYSYNKVATARNTVRGIEWEFGNTDIPNTNVVELLQGLRHIFDDIGTVVGKEGDTKNLTRIQDFIKVFSAIPLGSKEKRMSNFLQDFTAEEFLSFDEAEQIALLTSGNVANSINKVLVQKLSPEVRNHYLKIASITAIGDRGIYDVLSDPEKQQINKRVIKSIYEMVNEVKEKFKDDPEKIIREIIHYKNAWGSYELLTPLKYKIACSDPELRKIYVDGIEENNKNLRKWILDKVAENGYFAFRGGTIDLNHIYSTIDHVYGIFPPRYVLPDLSDITVKGNFIISSMGLTSLKGCPKVVLGTFNCSSNHLETLEGGPRAAGEYEADNCVLKSLIGAPKYVYDFDISYNHLTTLEYTPLVTRRFNASYNNLISLKGGPKVLSSKFNVSSNRLQSLEHAPLIAGSDYNIDDNPFKSLQGYTFKQRYTVDRNVYKHYEKQFRDLGVDQEDIDDKSGLSDEDKRYMEKMTDAAYDGIQNELEIAKQEYRQNAVKQESVVYNLMKSYLLRS